MPFKHKFSRNKRRYIPKRRSIKRYSIGKPRSTRPIKKQTNEWQYANSGGLTGPVKYQVMKYTDIVTLTSSASGGNLGSTNEWALNRLFTVNLTGSGHQPYSFNQAAALYGNYRVYKVDVEIMGTTPGGTANMLMAAMVKPAQQSFTLQGNSNETAMEMQTVATQTVTSSGNNRSAKICKTFYPHQIEGVSVMEYNTNPNYSATVAANPAYVPRIEIGVGVYDPSITAQNLTVTVTLNFHVKLWEQLMFNAN